MSFQRALAFLAGDQQAAVGLFWGSQVGTLANPLTPDGCAKETNVGATRLVFPAPGTFDVDHNPTRVSPRHLFDASVGDDNIFHGGRYRVTPRFSVPNLTTNPPLFNLLSTLTV